ncbi:MAG TPA: ATP-binding protein [Acidimicrobiales bacterium]|nr:ATP-binding protein [Acidimicrobiales bacterium]
MDWYLDDGDDGSIASAVAVVVDHLRRRLPAPEVVASQSVTDAISSAAAPGSGVWLRLDWERPEPALVVRSGGRAGMVGPPVAPGLWEVNNRLPEMTAAFGDDPGVRTSLPVSRPPEADIDLPPAPLPDGTDAANFVGAVAAVVPWQVDAGTTTLEAAAACGCAGASIAEAAYRAGRGVSRPLSASEIAEAFVVFQREAGGDFFVVESGPRRAVLANRRCPFGPAVVGRPAMCRVTSATLGSLAARSSGQAQVVLDEMLALGDTQCRAVVDLDPDDSPVAHRYQWPPSGAGRTTEPVGSTQGFRVGLTLQLPRDRLSVPVVRHLVSHALAEVGVVDADADDVELVLSEACGNVIEHSGPGDAYEVLVTIGPAMAEIRVVDVGRGFDHESLSQKVAGPSDERGRGIRLMHALVDQVRFESAPERGTVVHLVKRLRFDDSVPARRLMLAALEDSEGDGAGGDG